MYRKIPKISPGAYIFQRPFLRGLFLVGLIFGGAYLRREICVSKSIGLAILLEVNLPYLLCYTLYLRAIFQVQALGGRFNGGFFALPVWGAYIWRGLFSEFYGNSYNSALLLCPWPLLPWIVVVWGSKKQQSYTAKGVRRARFAQRSKAGALHNRLWGKFPTVLLE